MVQRVLILSDVSLGFAVPQIHLLARSLAEEFQAETRIVEPDMKGRRDLVEVDGVQIHRIATRMPPHDMTFCVEYVRAIRKLYRAFAPDLLVVLNAGVLPPLLLEAHRPATVVYYMLESLEHQMAHGGALFYDINRMAAPFLDLVLVPEYRRFQLDKRRLGWPDIPVVEILNVSPEPKLDAPVTRAGSRFLYAGTLSRESGMDFLLDDRIAAVDIDVAGPIDTREARDFIARFTSNSTKGERRYLGLLPHHQILQMLPTYTYRLVMWKAENVNSYFASPNKFFESIAHGVPPVCTPNPQICDIVRKYQCGLLSSDWGVASFCHAVSDAVLIAGTPTYDNLVANCARARTAEINWPHQFQKIRAALQAIQSGGTVPTDVAPGFQPDDAADSDAGAAPSADGGPPGLPGRVRHLGKSTPAARDCPICQTATNVPIGEVSGRALLICPECRHVFWQEWIDRQQLQEYYKSNYHHHQDEIQERNRAYYRSHATELAVMLNGEEAPPRCIVDFGCSYPTFLQEAAAAGMARPIGVDYSPQVRRAGEDAGIEMWEPEEFVQNFDGQADIIRFSHVIEHMENPAEVFAAVARYLAPGGIVYVTQPIFPVLRCAAASLPFQDAVFPEHLHFFNPISLTRVVMAAGLEIEEFFAFQAGEGVQSIYRYWADLDYAQTCLPPAIGDAPAGFSPLGGRPTFYGENCRVVARKAGKRGKSNAPGPSVEPSDATEPR